MTALEVLAEVLRSGGRIIPDPDRPRLVVPPKLKRLVLEHREALRALVLAGETSANPLPASTGVDMPGLLAMPLDVFAREGRPVEVRVPWWPDTLWFVPDVRHAEALCRDGIARARIWTAAELIALLSVSPLTTAALLTVMRARAAFGGEVVEVRRQ